MYYQHPVECSRYWMRTLRCSIALCWFPLSWSLEYIAPCPPCILLWCAGRLLFMTSAGILGLHLGFVLIATLGRRGWGGGGIKNGGSFSPCPSVGRFWNDSFGTKMCSVSMKLRKHTYFWNSTVCILITPCSWFNTLLINIKALLTSRERF